MSKLSLINENSKTAIIALMKKLLDSGKISGVFSLRQQPNGTIDYALFSDISTLAMMEPFFPLMPLNAGQILSRFTPLQKPIAAIIKPCELRAFIEMVKREQVRKEDFLIFTYSCNGVYPLQKGAAKSAYENLPKYKESLEKSEIPDGIRETCRICDYIYHDQADIYIPLMAKKDEKTELYLQTEMAEEYLSELLEIAKSNDFNEKELEIILEKRRNEKDKILQKVNTKETGLDGLLDIFGKCIGCHGCNSVCPICYCTLCDFDSFNYDYNRGILEKELKQKGALRLPPDTLFFHIGRLSHMSFSCVGCGMCSDVCQADIPVALVFKHTGEETAGIFEFVAGRSIEEDIPVMIYKEEEFPELGE